MEKNQHNNSPATKENESNSSFSGDQPGQQPPAGSYADDQNHSATPAEERRHSESSFPKQDGETLGTP